MIITKEQLEGFLRYMKMHGVESMEVDKETIEETLQNFGPVDVKINFPNIAGTCCGLFHASHT